MVLRFGEDLALGRAPRSLVRLGLAWGCAVLVRDAGLYLTVVPAALCFAAATPAARPRAIAAFLLPALVLIGVYGAWNQCRTGAPFISVTAVANYLRPDFEMARTGLADPFADESAVSDIAREHPDEYAFPTQLDIVQRVHDRLGLTSPLALGEVERRHYLRTVMTHPVAYARYVARNLDPSSFGAVLFDPISSLNDYFQLGLPPYRRVVPGAGFKNLRELAASGRIAALAMAGLSLLATIAATLGWIATVLGVPLLARRGGWDGPGRLALAMLAAAFAVLGFFALVHVESRHIMPAIPAGLIAAAYVAAHMRFLRRTAPSPIIQE